MDRGVRAVSQLYLSRRVFQALWADNAVVIIGRWSLWTADISITRALLLFFFQFAIAVRLAAAVLVAVALVVVAVVVVVSIDVGGLSLMVSQRLAYLKAIC